MKRFAFIMKSETEDIMGSDVLIYLDARFTMEHSKDECRRIAASRKKCNPCITGFKIYTGEILRNTPLTKYIKL